MAAHPISDPTQAALRERVKELTCLYGIARIAARPDSPLETVLRVLPPGDMSILEVNP